MCPGVQNPKSAGIEAELCNEVYMYGIVPTYYSFQYD